MVLQTSVIRAKSVFVGDFARQIEDTAKVLGVPESWLLTTLFPVLGASMTSDQGLLVSKASNYVVSPIFWGLIAASEKDEALAFWLQESIAKLQPQDIVAESLVSEDIARSLEDRSGLFHHAIDSRKLLAAKNAEFLMRVFDGKSQPFDSATYSGFLILPCFNIFGAFQGDSLKKAWQKTKIDNFSGFMARFLLCSEPALATKESSQGEKDRALKALSVLMIDLHESLQDLSEVTYSLSAQARSDFESWRQYLLAEKRVNLGKNTEFLYPKIEGYTAKFALLLHVVNSVLDGRQPVVEVSGETMQSAIDIASHYVDQAKIVYGL